MPVGLGSEIAWWCPTLDNAGNGSGTTFDLSGNSRNAGATTWTTDGSNRYLAGLTSASTFAIGNTYTWARWVYLTSIANNRPVHGFNDSTNRLATCIGSDSLGNVYMQHGTTAQQFQTVGSASLGLNQWRHLALRLVNTSGSNFTSTTFVDGIPTGTINFSGTLRTTSAQFTTSATAIGSPATQRVDDFRFYNRALSDVEVAALATRRGYQPTLPTGLGGEVLWICPSLDNAGNGTNVAWDLTGINNPGVLTNMDPPTDWVADTSNGGVRALDFDGTNDYVNVPDASPLNLTTTATVSCWVYPRANLYGWVQSKRSGAADPPYGIARFTSNNAFFLTSNSLVNYKTVFSSSNSVPNDSWTHILGTFNGSADIQIYINGILDTASTESGGSQFSAMQTTATPLLLGRYETQSTNLIFNGIIDDTRLYNRVLSPAEIRLLASQRGYQLPKDSRRRRYAGAYGL